MRKLLKLSRGIKMSALEISLRLLNEAKDKKINKLEQQNKELIEALEYHVEHCGNGFQHEELLKKIKGEGREF